jgi:hypothetical protein
MMIFDPEVGQSIKGGNVAGRHIHECYNETKKNQSWGTLPGDHRRVISSQRLKQPMK